VAWLMSGSMLMSGSCETDNEDKRKQKEEHVCCSPRVMQDSMTKKSKEKKKALTKRRYCLTSCEFFMCRSLCLNLSRIDSAKNTTMLGDPPMTTSRILPHDTTPQWMSSENLRLNRKKVGKETSPEQMMTGFLQSSCETTASQTRQAQLPWPSVRQRVQCLVPSAAGRAD